MADHVDIVFDCIPLRGVAQLRPPLDASADQRQRCERIAEAIKRHGSERAYWLENAHCTFHLANSEMVGAVRFEFSGVALTDAGDARTERVELSVRLAAETCGGVPAAVGRWLVDQVQRAVAVEFDRYLAARKPDKATHVRPLDDAGL